MSIEYYQANADEFFSNTISVDMTPIYKEFTVCLPSNALILDAGCGSGRDTKAFIEMGFSVSAFDGSSKLAQRASEYTGIKVDCSTFEDITEVNLYDGIWCCASLLHVAEENLIGAFTTLTNALKPSGVLYVSFKYGDSEREVDGRLFTDLNEMKLKMLIAKLEKIRLKQIWVSEDKRPERQEKWLNAILIKPTDL